MIIRGVEDVRQRRATIEAQAARASSVMERSNAISLESALYRDVLYAVLSGNHQPYELRDMAREALLQ